MKHGYVAASARGVNVYVNRGVGEEGNGDSMAINAASTIFKQIVYPSSSILTGFLYVRFNVGA